MGLFDKKFCDVCGEKIGLLGNRKLDDGNLCKDCARKLSPFFSERRSSTVAQIKEQLEYREENKRNLQSFNPTLVFGNNEKVYVDVQSKKFIVTRSRDWRSDNPDIINISQVLACNTDIVEHRDEIYREDADGNSVSYNPPRYEIEYEFRVELSVDSPWFSEIELELSDGDRPQNVMTDMYREYERQMYELSNLLTGNAQASNQPAYNQPTYNQPAYNQAAYNQTIYNQPTYSQPAYSHSAGGAMWVCSNCNSQNQGEFCPVCGSRKPMGMGTGVRCDKCGWVLTSNQPAPNFCPQCGDPIDFRDKM